MFIYNIKSSVLYKDTSQSQTLNIYN